jgi:hypothetical protein
MAWMRTSSLTLKSTISVSFFGILFLVLTFLVDLYVIDRLGVEQEAIKINKRNKINGCFNLFIN